MVSATLELMVVITKTPRKLKIAAMMIALFGFIERVEIQVAMAFGASVHPLTVIVPRVSITVITRGGLVIKFIIKSLKVTVISSSSKYLIKMDNINFSNNC